jgi:3-oxoacyl-[acyl-carrier protein] reductase
MDELAEQAGRRAEPGCALGVTADVSQEADVRRLFDTALERFGAVHAVIHGAAISRESLLVSTSTADFDAVFATNLTGSFLVAHHALRVLLEQRGGGRIVFLGSISQNGAQGNAAYAASKGGVAGLVRSMSRRYSHVSIFTSLIVTGYVETAMSASLSEADRRALIDGCPLRRAASGDEIASLAMFLLGAHGIGGQAIFATGGLMEVPL